MSLFNTLLKAGLILALLFYILSFPKSDLGLSSGGGVSSTITTTSSTVSTTSTTLLPFLSEQIDPSTINYVNVTRIINKTETIYNIENLTRYITLNVSSEQTKALLNMRPVSCSTAPCSHGYSLAKSDCLDILSLKGSRFSEAWGMGYDPFAVEKQRLQESEIACFRRYSDDVILINGSLWYVSTVGDWFDSDGHKITGNVSLMRGDIWLYRQ